MQNPINQATNLNTPEAPQESFEYPKDRGAVPNRVQSPRPEVIQAFWRVLQQGNAYWQKYWSQDAPLGTNNQPTTTGEVDSKGIDRCKDAGKVWCWTKVVVDEKKKLWGPWSISATGTRHWICLDLEPKATSSKSNESLKSLSPAIIEAETTYALGSYARWHCIRLEAPEIICLALVQTSTAHYHMWVLLDRPVDQARHSEILDLYYSGYPKDDRYQCKDTDRAKNGHGDHFRAPWCWRNGHEILAIEYCGTDQGFSSSNEHLESNTTRVFFIVSFPRIDSKPSPSLSRCSRTRYDSRSP